MNSALEKVEAFVITTFSLPSRDSRNREVQELVKQLDLSKPLYQGHVFKCKGSTGIKSTVNCFNKRYFLLFPKVILYYEHKREYFEDMKYGLSRYNVLKLEGLYLTYVDVPPSKYARFCINLHLPDPFNKRQKIMLAFRTRKQKRVWMAALQAQNPNLVAK